MSLHLMILKSRYILVVTDCACHYFVSRASNQKASDSPTPQQDQSHSHSQQSDSGSNHSTGKPKNPGSSKGHSLTARGMGTEHSNNSHSRHAGSGKRGQKDTTGSQKHEVGDETLKSNSRPGSVSPNTQRSAQSRTLDPAKRPSGGGGGGRGAGEIIRTTTNHSRGSSLTPNLSPHSTLSASSSSGSLRLEAEYGSTTTTTTTTITNAASAGGVVMGMEPKTAPEEVVEEGRGEGAEGVAVPTGSGSSTSVSAESELSNGTDASSSAVLEQLEAVHLNKSERHLPELQPSATSHSRVDITQTPPVRDGNLNPSSVSGALISSPPGLSKSWSQPLPVSKQSEMVCQQLDLSSGLKPSPLLARSESLGVGSQTGMLSRHLLSRDGGGGGGGAEAAHGGIGSVEQRRTGMVPTTSLSNDGMCTCLWTCVSNCIVGCSS